MSLSTRHFFSQKWNCIISESKCFLVYHCTYKMFSYVMKSQNQVFSWNICGWRQPLHVRRQVSSNMIKSTKSYHPSYMMIDVNALQGSTQQEPQFQVIFMSWTWPHRSSSKPQPQLHNHNNFHPQCNVILMTLILIIKKVGCGRSKGKPSITKIWPRAGLFCYECYTFATQLFNSYLRQLSGTVSMSLAAGLRRRYLSTELNNIYP